MTPEQIRIAMAEVDGWRLEHGGDGEFALISPSGLLVASDFDPCTTLESFDYKLPDYPNDLNAVHEVEKKLFSTWDAFNRRKYLQLIDSITGDQWLTIIATALQRCEAILRTLGKWKD